MVLISGVSDEVRVGAAENIIKCVELLAREPRLMAFLPLVLVGAAELLECVRHLRDGKRAAAETFLVRQ